MKIGGVHSRRNPPRWRAALLPLLLPGVVTLLAAFPGEISTASAALAYVLAVASAAALGGRRSGLLASVVSFLALNYFFTEPIGTFVVDKTEDLVALGVYLLVSSLVGTLLSTALYQRSRAARRERETQLLNQLATRLLAGDGIERVLEDFARGVTDLFQLAHCEITTLVSEPVAVGSIPKESEHPSETFPMFSENREVGSISLTPAPSRPGLEPEEREALHTFARQIGLGLARITLASEAREARLAAESNEVRAALFSSATHDLRTPLASITAAVTSLLGTDVQFTAQDHRELLETIRHEAERLNRLVTNFLELSRIRAGALTPSKSPVGIDEVIESVVARMRGVLSRHEVRLLIRDDLPDVPMDMVQIDQLLTNVLENAAKFSPPGTEIRISAARWHHVVRVQITDQGPGVRPDRREQVFHPFVGDHKENGAGTGLGLSIAHAIVLAHGGKIWIESAPTGGAAVTFELPLTG